MADQLLAAGRNHFVGEVAAKLALGSSGVAIPRGEFVADPREAGAAAVRLGGLLALKLVSPDVVHKSDVGAVELGLRPPEVTASAAHMADAARRAGRTVNGFLVEEMRAGGHELVVGGLRDERFGPIVMIGMGGVFVELLPEVAFRIAPLSESDAVQMIHSVRGIQLLIAGARGRAPLSEQALVEVLMRVGGPNGLLVRHAAQVTSVEVNPLLLTPDQAIALDARLELGGPPPVEPSHRPPSTEDFRSLFEPQTVAVVGASASRVNLGNVFLRHLRDYGYAGRIYPVHPSAPAIEGISTIGSLAVAPERIDYAYVTVGADEVPSVVDGLDGKVGFIQVVSSGFSEVSSGRDREARLVAAARRSGARLLGPNCLGTHSPRGRLTYLDGPSRELGAVAIISQSGGLSLDMVSIGQGLGIDFSGVVTLGNSADVTPADLLQFFETDPQTRVIGLYLEDVKDGRTFFDTLRVSSKPVVLLVGGQTDAGGRAAGSHTGALASNHRVWAGLAIQTGSVLTATLDEFLEALAALQSLRPRAHRPTSSVVLFGTGGGMSVLATDYLTRLGFSVPQLPARTLDLLGQLALPAGSSTGNPIDTPSGTMRARDGQLAADIAGHVFATADVDAVLVHLNIASFLSFTDSGADLFFKIISGISEARAKSGSSAHLLIVFRSSGEPHLDEAQREAVRQARSLGLAAFTRIEGAAHGLAAIREIERNRAATTASADATADAASPTE